MICGMAYRARAIRPYNYRKANTAKTAFDAEKTMSDVV